MNLALYGLGAGARRHVARRRCRRLVRQRGETAGHRPDLARHPLSGRGATNIAGIVLTHAHEDHFGALIDLWRKLKVPVYATPFTAALFEAKRLGEHGVPEIPINVDPLGSRFTLGPFDIEFVSVAHSIPESNALILRTPLGNVLHTGDWKLDPTPVIGPPTDEAKLRALGAEGCHVLLGDSTNAVREGRSPSETDVARTLTELIVKAPRRVGVTTFASNVARIRAVAERRAQASARSWWSAAPWTASSQVARETGYLDGVKPISRHRRLWLSAARQGRGALHRQPGRAARGARPHRPGRASRGGAVEGRPRDLLVAAHSRQREGDRPHHQRSDRPGRRGHHRPHASGARVRPSAPAEL